MREKLECIASGNLYEKYLPQTATLTHIHGHEPKDENVLRFSIQQE